MALEASFLFTCLLLRSFSFFLELRQEENVVSLTQAILPSSTPGRIGLHVDDACLSFRGHRCFIFSHRRNACYSFFLYFARDGIVLYFVLASAFSQLIFLSCMLVPFVQ